jgi:hypothetical protein
MVYFVEVRTLDQKWIRVLAYNDLPGVQEAERRACWVALALEQASGFVLAVQVVNAEGAPVGPFA